LHLQPHRFLSAPDAPRLSHRLDAVREFGSLRIGVPRSSAHTGRADGIRTRGRLHAEDLGHAAAARSVLQPEPVAESARIRNCVSVKIFDRLDRVSPYQTNSA